MLTIKDLKDRNMLFFEGISGSKAYGLDLPTSDTDIKGVFVLPLSMYYGLDYISQVNDEKNDIVYYELKRFVELLYKNNPNILEMLNTPANCVLYKHPLFDLLKPNLFLSKLCKNSFAGYAMTQIKKARGLNKKIMNPMPKERKGVLDFCFVQYEQGTITLNRWLNEKGFLQEQCGLVNIPYMKDVYGLYYDSEKTLGFHGVVRKKTIDTVLLSSIPKEAIQVSILYFNQDGYKKYCKDYKQYWEWVGNRNESRYTNTIAHGKNYDAKNIMHTFRLLDMAEEIVSTGTIQVKRPNRDALLKIRSGLYSYDELIKRAEEKVVKINGLYESSTLPSKPNKDVIEAILIKVRTEFYK